MGSNLRARTALVAEQLFLRKPLALYRERQVRPRRASDPLRLTFLFLARGFAWRGALALGFAWRGALALGQSATLLCWHREAFRLFWRWRSRPGRPPLPAEFQLVIAVMARDNPTWGEDRMTAELLLKLGIRVAPRTVRRDTARPSGGGDRRVPDQRGATVVRHPAQALVAGDSCVVVTATFQILSVSVALEIESRRLPPSNATAHPTAAWPLQQFREILTEPHGYRVVLHDRDSIYSPWLDAAVTALGVRVLRTPVQAPRANASCEWLLGSIRRECLDSLIPFGENHLRRILGAWKIQYHRGRPHAGLGPGLPGSARGLPAPVLAGHRLPKTARVGARSVLGWLHHEYGRERLAA